MGRVQKVYLLHLARAGNAALGGRSDVPEHTTTMTQKRLRILGDDEIAALYERPQFTDPERLEYFALSPREKAALAQFHSIKSRISFI